MKRKFGLLIGVMLVSLLVGSFMVVSADAVILSEDFSAADSTAFFSADYKALKTDASKPLYLVTAGTPYVSDGVLTLDSSRFTIGALDVTPTSASSTPGGTLDLSKPYKISFKVIAVKGNKAKKLQVYVDNNTTGMANSPHGGDSRLYSTELSAIKAGSTVEIQGAVGTANSFIQLRTESEGSITIDDLVIEYI